MGLFSLLCHSYSSIIDLSLLENPLTPVFVRVYCVAVDLMAQIKCYRAVLEVSGAWFLYAFDPISHGRLVS
jgi:hypothetical protein